MRLSRLVQAVRPSATFALDARAKALRRAGVPVLSLALGEPDFDTPEPVKEAALRALRAGATKYTEPAGLPSLREAVCEKLRRDQGLPFEPGQIAVTAGAKQAIALAFQALLDPGDQVLVPAPYWASYPDMVRLAGGVPVEVRGCAGFLPDLDDLERKAGAKARMIVLNSPNNPSGAVWPRAVLEKLADLAERRDLILLSDEIYEKMVYGAPHVSIASLSEGLAARTVIVNGCSKAFAMTGWRLGYAAAPKEAAAAIATLQSQSTSCVPAFVQEAAAEALRLGDALSAPMVKAFDLRRRLVLERVRAWPLCRVEEPHGAFYLFPDLSQALGKRLDGKGDPLADDQALSTLILDEARVAAVPGSAFGAPGHLRLSYAASIGTLEKACAAVAGLLARLR